MSEILSLEFESYAQNLRTKYKNPKNQTHQEEIHTVSNPYGKGPESTEPNRHSNKKSTQMQSCIMSKSLISVTLFPYALRSLCQCLKRISNII